MSRSVTVDVPLITRAEALKSGATQYTSWRKCPKGHEPPVIRQTINGSCARCNAEYAMARHKKGIRPTLEQRRKTMARWNASEKAAYYKQQWKERDPIRAWVVYSVGAARARAAQRGLPFDLTNEYVRSIIPETCPVLGVVLKFLQGRGGVADSATIDRIIPSKGYVQGNVAVISLRANLLKSNGSLDEIEKVAAWLRRRHD